MGVFVENLTDVGPMSQDRRLSRRFAMRLPVEVRSADDAFHPEHSLTRDISESGVFFYMRGKPREGAPIEFTVELPAEVTMTDPMRAVCRGRVVRVVEDDLADNHGVAATIEGMRSFIRLSGRPPLFELS